MAKTLSQILTVLKHTGPNATKRLERTHRTPPSAFSGFDKTFEPTTDDPSLIRLPSSEKVQVTAYNQMDEVRDALSSLFDLAYSRDEANTRAKADVIVDGAVFLADVPATYLLWLEKQLIDLRTFIDKLPTLDSSQVWSTNPQTGMFDSAPQKTLSTTKVPKVIVKYEATDKHPAQTELFHVDEPVGTWVTVNHSGALAPVVKADMLSRVNKLYSAVKVARETANQTVTVELEETNSVSAKVFGYLFY